MTCRVPPGAATSISAAVTPGPSSVTVTAVTVIAAARRPYLGLALDVFQQPFAAR